jgi:CheY-like chemotaxis protein
MAKVLVVEDNQANQRLMSMLLNSMGHEVVCATTGEEGWSRAQAVDYDLVLLDMYLPGLDGFELCKRIKAASGGRTRVVAVTALAMPGDRKKVMESGCDGYFSKPISLSDFRSRVQDILQGHSDE